MAGGPHTGKKIPEERLQLFLAEYLSNGLNATQACISIGLSKRTAGKNAWRYQAAIRARIDMQQALDAAGLTTDRLALKLNLLLDADMPKWNPGTEDWDVFANGSLQLDAAREIAKLRNLYPAEPERDAPCTLNLTVNVDRL